MPDLCTKDLGPRLFSHFSCFWVWVSSSWPLFSLPRRWKDSRNKRNEREKRRGPRWVNISTPSGATCHLSPFLLHGLDHESRPWPTFGWEERGPRFLHPLLEIVGEMNGRWPGPKDHTLFPFLHSQIWFVFPFPTGQIWWRKKGNKVWALRPTWFFLNKKPHPTNSFTRFLFFCLICLASPRFAVNKLNH